MGFLSCSLLVSRLPPRPVVSNVVPLRPPAALACLALWACTAELSPEERVPLYDLIGLSSAITPMHDERAVVVNLWATW